ncbi:MAG: hypothetical protein OEW00_08710 [candidate division Zixibacteria bacterium]|nr:hypothetical protein [candidate division Zixibacteria bacterium]
MDKFLTVNSVYLAGTVASEARYSSDQFYGRQYIDLPSAIQAERVEVIDLDVRDLASCLDAIVKWQAPQLDDGERETIGIVYSVRRDLILCLRDTAAIRCAVLIGLSGNVISIETALNRCGLKGKLEYGDSERRFRKIVHDAETERIQKTSPDSNGL